MTALNYRSPHFTRGILLDDMAFRSGPYPGKPLPDFEFPMCSWSIAQGGC